jgi:hypothetical protein
VSPSGIGRVRSVRAERAGRHGRATRLRGTRLGPTEDEAAVAGREAGGNQPLAERRRGDWLAVDLRDHELADPPVRDERPKRAGCRLANVWIVAGGKRLDRAAAAIDVQGRDTVDEDDVGACRALEWPSIVLAPSRPGDRRAVGIRGVRGSEQMDRAFSRVAARLTSGPEPFDRPCQCELGGP